MARIWPDSMLQQQLSASEPASLDTEVRAHAERLRLQATATLQRLALDWLTPAPGQPAPTAAQAQDRLRLGTLAALARFHLGRHDEPLSAHWLRTLATPRLCQDAVSAPGWAWHLKMLQQLPAAQRAAAFAADERGLAALANPDWQPPPRPSPSLREAVSAWLAEQRAGRGDGRGLGMDPVAAQVLLGAAGEPNLGPWRNRCLVAQWWARDRVHRGEDDAATAVLVFRYATLQQPQDWREDALGEPGAYPLLAARHGVEADIVVEWRRDALGRTTGHRVVKRELRVPDAPAGAWLAWEDQFDRHALFSARQRPAVKPAAGQEAAKPERVTFSFKLE